MVNVAESTSTTLAGIAGCVLQNLGPGTLFVGGDETHGVQLGSDQSISIGHGVSGVDVFAEGGDCDVRYFSGSGMSAGAATVADSIGPDFPEDPSDGQVWWQTSPGGAVAAQFSDHFASGSAASWTFAVGDTFDQSYAYAGPSGCRLTGAGAHAYMSIGTTKLTQGNPWMCGQLTFRLIQVPPSSAANIILMEALCGLASGTKDQYDLWLGKDGSLWVNLADSVNFTIDQKAEIGVWHTLEFCVSYGDPYFARTRYDGRRMPDISEAAPQGATTAATFYAGSQNATATFTCDIGDCQLATSATDPGFLNAGPPVMRQYSAALGAWL